MLQKTMQALVKREPVKGLWLTSVPVPAVGETDVMIRPSKVAICGTDLHIYLWDQWAADHVKTPTVLGHEYVGEVVAVGEAVQSVRVGDRVSGEGHIVCRRCRNCRAGREHLCPNTQGIGVNRDGAFAEYVVIPEHNVYRLPEGVPDSVAAILDPYGNAVHTALSFDLVGEDVLITGAGPIGIMAAAICRRAGARHVVVSDLNDTRLALAEKMGASRGVRADRVDLRQVMAELGMSEGFDVGLEMSGSAKALASMLAAMNNGAHVGLLGIHPEAVALDINTVIFKGLRLKGIYGREMFETWHKGIALLQSGLDLQPVITHTLPFKQFEQGLALMQRGEACKVVLDMADLA